MSDLPRYTMQDCTSCKTSKTAECFVHPTTQKQGKTCADCIIRRSLKTQTVADLELRDTVDDHGRRLDDHGHRLATIESGTDVRADIAEWLALADPDEDVGPGDLVELLDGKISRATTGKGRLFVVSTAPRLTGNVPEQPADFARGRVCAFMGQLPAKVRGAVAANQSLGPSGFDDGIAVATDAPTGIVALETSAADPADGFRLVNVLVNAGGSAPPADHAQRRWRKKQRQKQRRAAAADFVFVDESDAHSNALSDASTEDLASLASSHSCVARIVDEHAQLCVQVKMLSAALGGVRLLLRDPSARLAQRVTRGFIARRRCARRLDAVVTLQSSARLVLGAALYRCARGAVVTVQGLARIRFARAICKRESESAAAVVIGAAARCYLVLVATPIGKLLSKTRRLAAELEDKAEEILWLERQECYRDREDYQAADAQHLLELLHPPASALALTVEHLLSETPALSSSQLEALNLILDGRLQRVIEARIAHAVDQEGELKAACLRSYQIHDEKKKPSTKKRYTERFAEFEAAEKEVAALKAKLVTTTVAKLVTTAVAVIDEKLPDAVHAVPTFDNLGWKIQPPCDSDSSASSDWSTESCDSSNSSELDSVDLHNMCYELPDHCY
ncbi:hypothetical protein M885DRAFT_614023 [Pelagophyceae sp. CCMP2097]|nr:hypothetical protein M885DRAFT_614023 [Pelagophyceae sp. CCMP2097]